MKYIITSVVVLAVLFSCTKDKGLLPGSVATTTTGGNSTSDPCTTNITYSQHIAPILANTCGVSGCHGAGGGPGSPDFSTYALFKLEIESKGVAYIEGRTKQGGDMPPSYTTGPTITACQSAQLKAWLDAGYPNN
ncbi:MAG: hypothetical protein ACXVPQ_00670 [Bacteroidia bacterium]